MRKQLLGAVVAVLGLASIAMADGGDRHYPRGGGDRYDRQRYEASVRYERGSRNYDRTYVRYGQDNYDRRPSYDRDYHRRGDRDENYVRRSSWGLSLGYSNYGYAGDGVSVGLFYSSRPSYHYYSRGYSYHTAPSFYERRRIVYSYDDCSPTAYEYRVPSYYYRESGPSFTFYGRGYYSR
jgi:hypothetical protein